MGEHNLITQTNWYKNIEIVQQIMHDVNPSAMRVCLQFTVHDSCGHILVSTVPHLTPQVTPLSNDVRIVCRTQLV